MSLFRVIPLHPSGTPGMLQARGSDTARVRLIGTWKGTLPVTMRHAQSMLDPVTARRASQQSRVGDVPFAVLFVRKPRHGVKLAIIDALHGVLIWAREGVAERTTTAIIIAIDTRRPSIFFFFWLIVLFLGVGEMRVRFCFGDLLWVFLLFFIGVEMSGNLKLVLELNYLNKPVKRGGVFILLALSD